MSFLDFNNVLVLTSLVLHVFLFFILQKYAWQSRDGKAYAATIFFIAAWTFSMFFYRSSFAPSTLFWTRTLYISAAFIPTAFFIFSWVFLHEKRPLKKVLILAAMECFLILALLLHPDLIIDDVSIQNNAEHIIIFGKLYPLYVVHIVSLFFAGFVCLFNTHRKSENRKEKKQVSAIGLGFLLASSLAMMTNLFLPWFGYFELNWLGQIFSTIVAAFTTYAILRYSLLNINLLALECFIFVLNFFFILSFLSFFSKERRGYSIPILLLSSFIFISYISIRKARNLALLNAKLQELNKQKSEFLSIAAHQFRTPLTVISGYLELLKDGAFGEPSEEMQKVFTDLETNSGRLGTVVDDFLNLQKVEEGQMHFDFQKQDMAEVISNVIDELLPKANEKGLLIQWVSSAYEFTFDKNTIRHVLMNLFGNAIKYSDKGTIQIEVFREDNSLSIRVLDEGIGFEKHEAEKFFQAFYRGENAKHLSSTKGTGLGLYIARRFVEAHGGGVWARSEGVGRGSEFGFYVPVKGV